METARDLFTSLVTGRSYFTCEVCGNEYDKVFEVNMDGNDPRVRLLRVRHPGAGTAVRQLRLPDHRPRHGGRRHVLLFARTAPRKTASTIWKIVRCRKEKGVWHENQAQAKTSAKSRGVSVAYQDPDIMTPNVVVVSPDDTLQIAARKMQERDIGFLPVCDGQRLIGTLSDRDITVSAVAEGRDPRSTPVREFATPQPVWCFDDQDVGEAARKMQEKQVRRLMVLHREDKQLGRSVIPGRSGCQRHQEDLQRGAGEHLSSGGLK